MSEESIPHYNLETVGLVSRGVGQGGSVNTMVQGLFWVARLIENIHVNRQACGPGCLCPFLPCENLNFLWFFWTSIVCSKWIEPGIISVV